MLWMARATGIAMCHIAVAVAECHESPYGYQPTYEWLSRNVCSPLESRRGRREIQRVDDRCPVPATKQTRDVARVYDRL